ncbi:MAG: glycosyl hydrolase family 18 protein [Sedimentibacter sp.]|uniref:glycosyl hydrolase family 18 protein n=1 Tax=Sedimentibacter sp. TaxID=1960295 RepID=UPI00315861BD
MKKIITILIAALMASNTLCYAETLPQEDFKVVGYYSGDLFNEPLENLQTDKLTHVIYAFLIPKQDGTLEELKDPEELEKLTEKAHGDGARVFAALGGWSYEGKVLEPVFREAASSDETRKKLVDSVCEFAEKYNLDGVELDWEHPNKDTIEMYEKLAVELSQALRANGKELTAALNGAWSKTAGPEVSGLITQECLDSFSFINVMAYDINNDNHSPYWFSETSIDYWLNRGVEKEDIVLGMPLYARPSWLQYRHLVAKDESYAFTDYAPTLPLASYYNGMNTLKEKTKLAMRKAGGVMLFDVNEDTNDSYSIVSMIDSLLEQTKGYTKQELDSFITVLIGGREVYFSVDDGLGIPFINSDNRTMIPLRKSLETIGASVEYDNTTRTVIAVKGDTTVRIPIGQKQLVVNGQVSQEDTAAVIMEDRTYIPLRSVMKAFGYSVDYHDSSRTVIVSN